MKTSKNFWFSEVFSGFRHEMRSIELERYNPAGIYLLKVNNRNTRTSKTCSNLTIETPDRRHWLRSGIFIVNFEHISHIFQL